MRDYKKTGNPHEIRYCCPYCNDTGYHCYVNTKHGWFYCFKCGYGGTYNQLKKKLGLVIDVEPSTKPEVRKPSVKTNLESIYGIGMFQIMAKKYWERRGFTVEEAMEYKIMLNPSRLTLVIPVLDENGLRVFDIERSILKYEDMRYYIEPGARKAEYIFNLDKAKDMTTIVLVEGVFDAMAIRTGQGKALFGKFLSNIQLEKLRKSKIKKVLLMLDSDAKREAWTVYNQLMPYFEIEMLDIKETGHKDIAEYREVDGLFKMMTWLYTKGL